MSKRKTAVEKLLERANILGCQVEVIKNSRGHYRRHSSLGSTSVPQKVIEIDGKRFSIAGAKQYLDARSLEYKPRVKDLENLFLF